MKLAQYEERISATSAAAELHRLSHLAWSDPDLAEGQAEQVSQLVDRRFGALNLAASTFKPRWQTTK